MTSKKMVLFQGDCLDKISAIEPGTVDCIISDPPYPEIDRDYGRMTEAEWETMMASLIGRVKGLGLLKPRGSMVFVLQPNQAKVGQTRNWLYRFIAWASNYWNIVQPLYWWNFVALPTAGATHGGLCRDTLKFLVWLGDPDCYRNQDEILWTESMENAAKRAQARCQPGDVHTSPSGYKRDRAKVHAAAGRRGGVTPFNVWPISNTRARTGHGAETPFDLADKLIRYLCPPGGTVLDPFMGGGNIGVAALRNNRNFIGVEKMPEKFNLALSALGQEQMSEEEAA